MTLYLAASEVRRDDVLLRRDAEFRVIGTYVTRRGTVALCVDIRPWEFRHRPETEVLVRREEPR